MGRLTRKQCVKLGRKQFNSATPCKRCGSLRRYTSTGNCIKCHRAKMNAKQAHSVPQSTRDEIKAIILYQLNICECCCDTRLTMKYVVDNDLYKEGQKEIICKVCIDEGETPIMRGE